jgi:hypothetical protein
MADITQINRDKAKSQSCATLGIPVGSTLVFKKDPAITVKTLDEKNKVEYQGKPFSISTLAKQLVGSPVSGYLYFKFEGKTLKSLVKNGAKPVVVPDSAGEANKAPEFKEYGPERDLDPLAGEIEADAVELAHGEAEIEA